MIDLDRFWKKYNHCPLCKKYIMQSLCGNCVWKYPVKIYDFEMDNFEPTEECVSIMNKWDREGEDGKP